MAVARDRLGQEYHVVAVIGDGSLTNGLTLEALNNIGKNRLIIVLNDNGYAISKNVGSIAKYLNGISRHCFYNDVKNFFKKYATRGPLGRYVVGWLSALKGAIKALLLPSSFFEHHGLKYIGPIDGHNVAELVENLRFCKEQKRPMLLHVKTRKGHGDPRSESCPEKAHGISIAGQRRVSYSAVFGEKICQLAEQNPKIVAITAAMADGTGLALFRERYPERFFDVGIAESHAITFAAGLSKAGLLPVCAIYSTFLQRAFDQIFHDIALQNLPIIIGIDRAGLCANDGPTHHGLFDLAFLRAIPDLIIMQPKDPRELGAMLEAAVNFNAPCCIRYPREMEVISANGGCDGSGGNAGNNHGPFPTSAGIQLGRSEVMARGVDISANGGCGGNSGNGGNAGNNHGPFPTSAEIQLGRSEIIARGADICLIALGEKVGVALEIARRLPQLSFTIINARFVKPLDCALFGDCARHHRFVYTIEDHVKSGGFGSAVAEFLAEENLAAHVHIFSWPDTFIPHASRNDDLKKMFHFTTEDIIEKIRADQLHARSNAAID
jgi:1-deoxy-D-xylulose-5-phosphate synthase